MKFPFFRKKSTLMKTRVLIIGGGATGTGVARDLSLRGVACILVDQDDIEKALKSGSPAFVVARKGDTYIVSNRDDALPSEVGPARAR